MNWRDVPLTTGIYIPLEKTKPVESWGMAFLQGLGLLAFLAFVIYFI